MGRSLCARLCNICEGGDDTSRDRSVSVATLRTDIDLRNIVVITWCLDRLSRRDCNDAHLPRAALTLLPSLSHWVDEALNVFRSDSYMLLDVLPVDHYAKLCTAFLCLDNIFGRCLSGDSNQEVQVESRRIAELYSRLASNVLEACLREAVERERLPSCVTPHTSFEEAYEAHISFSINVLMAINGKGFVVDNAIQLYWDLLKRLDLTRIRSLEMLVKSFGMLCDGKLPNNGAVSMAEQLLDTLGTRDLHDVSSDHLYDLIHGCARANMQHLGILDAVSDALVQRSHRLPDVSWVVKVLDCFRLLSYHNPSVLELLVRHVHNNAKAATPEQLATIVDCCRVLKYSHTNLEALVKDESIK